MRGSLSKRALQAPQEPMINITPLIDVVFVILIAFIVIAPLLDLDRINLAKASEIPAQNSEHFQDASAIQIHVYADNTLSLNEQKISLEDIQQKLYELRKLHPDIRPQLFHDKKAYFGTYQSVKNSLEAAGFQEMDVVLSPS
jgi:biopolymer transport protein ExbD